MKSQKHPSVQRVTPPRFILIKSMACGLALLASGQAFASEYFSTSNIVDADLASPANWFDDGCAGSNIPASISLTGASMDRITICAGHSLDLSTATLNATLRILGTWGVTGTGIKFGAGNKAIHNFSGATITIPSLNLSLMAAGATIGFNGTDPMIFTNVTGKSLECPSGTPYNGGTTQIASPKTCTVVAAAVNNSVSAPIFSTKEKPAVFSEEVK